MIELTNRHQNGSFTYTAEGVRAEGSYDADFTTGQMRSMYAAVWSGNTNLGSVDVNVSGGQPNYNIHASELLALLTIAQNIGTIYAELAEALAEQTEE